MKNSLIRSFLNGELAPTGEVNCRSRLYLYGLERPVGKINEPMGSGVPHPSRVLCGRVEILISCPGCGVRSKSKSPLRLRSGQALSGKEMARYGRAFPGFHCVVAMKR